MREGLSLFHHYFNLKVVTLLTNKEILYKSIQALPELKSELTKWIEDSFPLSLTLSKGINEVIEIHKYEVMAWVAQKLIDQDGVKNVQ